MEDFPAGGNLASRVVSPPALTALFVRLLSVCFLSSAPSVLISLPTLTFYHRGLIERPCLLEEVQARPPVCFTAALLPLIASFLLDKDDSKAPSPFVGASCLSPRPPFSFLSAERPCVSQMLNRHVSPLLFPQGSAARHPATSAQAMPRSII